MTVHPVTSPSDSKRGEKILDDLQLWLCPHKTQRLSDASRLLLYKPPDSADDYSEKLVCQVPNCRKYMVNSIQHRSAESPALTLRTSMRLFLVSDCVDADGTVKRYFTISRAKAALIHLALPLCRHLCTSDQFVYEHFTPRCTGLIRTGPGWRRQRLWWCSCRQGDAHVPPYSKHYKSCAECKDQGSFTCFGFRTREHTENGKKAVALFLSVFRDLGGLQSSSEAGWRLHALDIAGVAHMPQQWEAWMEFVKSKGAMWERTPFPTYLDRLGSGFMERMASVKEKFISPVRRTKQRLDKTSTTEAEEGCHALGKVCIPLDNDDQSGCSRDNDLYAPKPCLTEKLKNAG